MTSQVTYQRGTDRKTRELFQGEIYRGDIPYFRPHAEKFDNASNNSTGRHHNSGFSSSDI